VIYIRQPHFTSLHPLALALALASISGPTKRHLQGAGDSSIHRLLATDKTKSRRCVAATLASQQLGQHDGNVGHGGQSAASKAHQVSIPTSSRPKPCSISATDPSLRYDLTSTFDVLVGKELLQQRFTAHTNVLTERSEFFRAARSSQWLVDPAKPVDLEDDDPQVFSAYLECVYFGVEAIGLHVKCEGPRKPKDDTEEDEPTDTFEWSHGECRKRRDEQEEQDPRGKTPYTLECNAQILFLARIYLQANKLQDFQTANLVIDEIIRFSEVTKRNPTNEVVNLVYGSTVHGNPLRKLMRDYLMNETVSAEYLDLHSSEFHSEFLRDIAVEFLRVKDYDRKELVRDVYHYSIAKTADADKNYYHQHVSSEGMPWSFGCVK
jgi:hypothetical protein